VTLSQGLADKCSFQVADALQQPFKDGAFDLVYSMESGEHMPIKQKFVGELARVCAPGGRILIVTWCHRDLEEVSTLLYSCM
jgi:tocopherol O-methyltransferase